MGDLWDKTPPFGRLLYHIYIANHYNKEVQSGWVLVCRRSRVRISRFIFSVFKLLFFSMNRCFFLGSFCLGLSFRVGVLGQGFGKLGSTIQQQGGSGWAQPPQLSAKYHVITMATREGFTVHSAIHNEYTTAGPWGRLEDYIRSKAIEKNELFVITGVTNNNQRL